LATSAWSTLARTRPPTWRRPWTGWRRARRKVRVSKEEISQGNKTSILWEAKSLQYLQWELNISRGARPCCVPRGAPLGPGARLCCAPVPLRRCGRQHKPVAGRRRMHGIRGVAGSRSLLEVVAKALSVDSHSTRMVDEAIAKALSVNRTLLDEGYLPRPCMYAVDRRRFETGAARRGCVIGPRGDAHSAHSPGWWLRRWQGRGPPAHHWRGVWQRVKSRTSGERAAPAPATSAANTRKDAPSAHHLEVHRHSPVWLHRHEAVAVSSICLWAMQVHLIEQRPVHGQRLRDGLVHHLGWESATVFLAIVSK